MAGPAPQPTNNPKGDGWTLVEGPVRFDDGVLVGRLKIYAKGSFRQADLGGPGTSRSSGKWYISRQDLVSAFKTGMEARTGCRAASRVGISSIGGGIVGIKVVLDCG